MNATPDALNHVIDSVTRLLSIAMGMQPYDVLAWAMMVAVVVIMKRWHEDKANGFNLSDLLCTNGIIDSSKFTRTGSWVVMSYGFYLLAKTSPESLVAYAPLYGGIWVSAKALDKWQQTNNVSIESKKEVEEKTTTNITYTEEQKDQMKQDTYVEGEH